MRHAHHPARPGASRTGQGRYFRLVSSSPTTAALSALGLPEQIRAALFDMDGVLTQTSTLHRHAWKSTFDPILAAAGQSEFTDVEYAAHVDGRRRYDGVRTFLASRELHPPEGEPTDSPEAATVCGIGNRKNLLIEDAIHTEGVQTYPGTVAYLKACRAAGLATAVVTASANGGAVLAAAGLDELLDARIDGLLAARENLPGKPAPDTYLAGAQALGVSARQAVVIEDATSGVRAGRAGGFRYVIGVDRLDQAQALAEAGADVVVDDLAELLEVHP